MGELVSGEDSGLGWLGRVGLCLRGRKAWGEPGFGVGAGLG